MAADSVLDLREVPGTVFRAANVGQPRDHEWACDGCRALLLADPRNEWTPSRLAREAGATVEQVRHLRAKELAEEEAREEHRQGRPVVPDQVFARALARLPAGVHPPGSEAPGHSRAGDG